MSKRNKLSEQEKEQIKLNEQKFRKRMEQKEKAFFNKINKIRQTHKEKNNNKIFEKWVELHDDDLRNIYDDCIGDNLTYEEFTNLAYLCSEKCSC